MPRAENMLVSRPDGVGRARLGVPGVLLLPLGMLGVAAGSRWAWIVVALAVFGVTEFRRRAWVRDGRLIAQGRLIRRSAELSELTRVTVSPMHRVWVATRSGQVFYLRMVTDVDADGLHLASPPFHEQLRGLALEAGATLQDEPGLPIHRRATPRSSPSDPGPLAFASDLLRQGRGQ